MVCEEVAAALAPTASPELENPVDGTSLRPHRGSAKNLRRQTNSPR